ncbi:transcription-repair coupling factor [Methyloversatilis sp. XJ19-49]|uniref:transcription-repair coupling factor n=1 Tax=Methyloversatilis sp. XJ19-49 TaxID=2963429 RepID=UPI00211C1964|nr:transcription-repair coupling factor [Methyloversatilis sp. XJ19-49]MCQ9376696.1 transcription-repair coupling factor [Methyloversatilis sp. XJ19-49]
MTTSPSLLKALSRPRPASRIDWPPLPGGAQALALAGLAKDAGAPLVVVAARPMDAQRLVDELRWFAPTLRSFQLPDWETLPYDQFSPHNDLVSERLETLYALMRGELDVLVVPASTALYRLAPREYLAAHTFFVKQGEKLDVERLRLQLTVAGYGPVTQVVAPGEYSVRGGLVDLYPMGAALPYRIDLFDDEVESIRTFDVDTQRTVFPTKEIRLLPAREFPMDDKARTAFRSRFREAFEGDPSKSVIYKDVSNGVPTAGIEYYIPLFFEHTDTLFDYLPANAMVALDAEVNDAIGDFWRDTKSRFDLMKGERARPILPPTELFLSEEQFHVSLANRAIVRLGRGAPDTSAGASALPELGIERKAADPLHRLRAQVAAQRVVVIAESAGRRETLIDYFAEYGLASAQVDGFDAAVAADAALTVAIGPLVEGFALLSPAMVLVTESELYPTQARSRGKRDGRKVTAENFLRDLTELKIGDPVVHLQHGIGRYIGLTHMDLGEGETEFLHLEYADGDKLYVPVSQLHQISRYSGAPGDQVHLHKLGSGQWDKAKKRAAAQVRDTAAELLALYAQRSARKGHTFGFKQHDMDAFAEGFGFEETPDQMGAITAVVGDMTSGRPMDRLVCGDVGFGKTEVALRAAFVAVADGKQVAVLAPTTLLAEQHYQTFSDRFAQVAHEWPARIAEISRFKSAKEQTQALKEAAEGKIDVLIGTHRLLQKDVSFARLGLVIIDEEHRFGVRQKEALKSLRAEVDVLTLTATPIPRTLAMSLEGIRDFSVIATAPQKRLAIKTFVSPWSRGLIREAVLREFKRGGQVYFLHNEVDTIEEMGTRLADLLPEARIVIGHGQLPERELERVMREFTQRRHNLLLCTTIIETGIDNPNANTIIINRADRFGLAQLHQLRGRVGRSHHQAYAYLLTDAHAKPTEQGRRRLEAITMMEELGSGFYLAMHDLEIRGAGEVLGESQSGEMQEIGFNLYTDMLKSAVKSLQKGEDADLTQPLDIVSEINLHTPALLPTAYCPDVHERLTLYKRLANCETVDEVSALREELVDRFGQMPDQTRALLETHRLRIAAKPLGITKIDAHDTQILVTFVPNPPIEPIRIIQLVQKDRNFKLAGQDRLSWKRSSIDLDARVAGVRELMKKLTC